MNYYNPYFYTLPTSVTTPKVGLLGRLFGSSGVTLSGILNGTQRALNFANQAIPLVKQVKPVIGNAKTMFRVMSEFKRAETPSKVINNTNNNIQSSITDKESVTEVENNLNGKINIQNETVNGNEGPTFFV